MAKMLAKALADPEDTLEMFQLDTRGRVLMKSQPYVLG